MAFYPTHPLATTITIGYIKGYLAEAASVLSQVTGQVYHVNIPDEIKVAIAGQASTTVIADTVLTGDRPTTYRDQDCFSLDCSEFFSVDPTYDPDPQIYDHVNADDTNGVVLFKSPAPISQVYVCMPLLTQYPYAYGREQDIYVCQPDCSRTSALIYVNSIGTYLFLFVCDDGTQLTLAVDSGIVNYIPLCTQEDQRVPVQPPSGYDLICISTYDPVLLTAGLPFGATAANTVATFADLSDLMTQVINKNNQLGRPISLILHSHGNVNSLKLDAAGNYFVDQNTLTQLFGNTCHGMISNLYFLSCCTGGDNTGGTSYILNAMAQLLCDPFLCPSVTVYGWDGVIGGPLPKTVLDESRWTRPLYLAVNKSAIKHIRTASCRTTTSSPTTTSAPATTAPPS